MPIQNNGIAVRLIHDLQRDLGITPWQAAGIVGSLSVETGGFTSLEEGEPNNLSTYYTPDQAVGGFGYAQWTGPRRREFHDFITHTGLDPFSYEANYGMLMRDFAQPYWARELDRVRKAEDAQSAAQIFTGSADEGQGFLRPGTPHLDRRKADALEAMDLYHNKGGYYHNYYGDPNIPAPVFSPADPPSRPGELSAGQNNEPYDNTIISGTESTDTLEGKGGSNAGLGLVYNPATGAYEPGSNPTSAQPEAPGSDWQTNPGIISGEQSTNTLQGGAQPVTNFGMGAPPAGVPAGWYQAPGGQWYDPTDPQYAHMAGKALPPPGGGGGVTNLGMGAQNVSGGVEPAGFSDFGMGATTGNPHWDVNTPEGWTRINEPWKPELQPGGKWYVPADELWGAPEGHSSTAWDDGSGGSAFGRSYNENHARAMQGLGTLNAQGAAQPQAAQASYNAGQQGFYNNAPSAFTPDYGMGTQQPIFGDPMGAYAGAVTPSYDPR
jgi:hypothetical protein